MICLLKKPLWICQSGWKEIRKHTFGNLNFSDVIWKPTIPITEHFRRSHPPCEPKRLEKTKTAEKNTPFGAAHTYIAYIREYPRGEKRTCWLKRALTGGVSYPLSSMPLPFFLPPYPVHLSTPATQATHEKRFCSLSESVENSCWLRDSWGNKCSR